MSDNSPANDSGPALPLFYKTPVPLDPARLGKHGLVRARFTAAFARGAHAVPISLTEFHLVAKHFPIVFGPGDPPMPLAALSISRNENLFVDDAGAWAEDTYIPAYVRRYPFVLAELPDDNRMVLCVDTKADMVSDEAPDLPLFNGNQPTEVANQALELCRRFHEDLMMTKIFCEELKKVDLLKETELKYTSPDGQPVVAGRFISIESSVFDKLADDVFLDFRKRSILPAIYLQQTSQTNWARLATRKQKRLAKPPGTFGMSTRIS